ncbi:NUDIX hydrolase [Candidatus Uabimicrobium amorphum]|uniref:DNA mismatch repair protein MutT n=1 Tax=Uabimicrobium amorphum TaxID=2596890 RepID=A0A5S9ITP9_UABAM|nr:NUDIX hydrolase [Candidatus Uabimicrobium amorphum]BBM87973.1 DNA mismatch repair protein MutT [Candidatus Uabimicrobium amorphum]
MSTNYQQACAIPYRMEDKAIYFCLITSRNHGDWIFPKGCIDGEETPQETALKEANEEAGLEGEIVTDLGAFTYHKRGFDLLTSVQLMRVTHCKNTWLELDRKRCWVSSSKAQKRIERVEMQKALQKAIDWLSQQQTHNQNQ